MSDHNKISFVREYCNCRRIPYRIVNEALYIGKGREKHFIMYSVYNLTYKELIETIDRYCEYDPVSTHFVAVKNVTMW